MLTVYTLSEDSQWNRCVKEIDSYEVFYLSDYLRAFQIEGSGEPLLVVYQNNDDYAVNAIFVRDIALEVNFKGKIPIGKYYDISSPYGYGGFIGEIREPKRLLSEWSAFCKNKGFISEFVRFSLFSKNKEWFDGIVETKMQNIVRTLDISLDEIYKDFKAKVRKNINRANEYKLKIIIDEKGVYFKDFLNIYYSTMNRSNAEKSYYFSDNFFKTILGMDNSIFFHVSFFNEREGLEKIISTELVLYDNINCYSYLGGTDKDYFFMRPNDFLKYEVIKWAIEKQLKRFVLGGGYGTNDGIFQYKKCLAPHGIIDFYIGKKIWNLEVYQKLCELKGVDVNQIDFFPAYRQ